MTQYPMKFSVSSEGPSGIQTAWKTKAANYHHEIPLSIPPEFDGPGTGLSPEDLYAMALQNCYVATFKVFAEKSNLQYDSILAEALLEVDRNEKNQPWMARLHLNVTLKGAIEKEKAQRILERTSKSCMILNSVNTEKTFHFEF